MRRLCAATLALVIGTVASLPVASAFWCAGMQRHLERPCCDGADAEDESANLPELAITTTCCERLASHVLQTVASPHDGTPTIAAPSLTGTLTFPPVLLPSACRRGALAWQARSRGRPPGELLDLFSPILRV